MVTELKIKISENIHCQQQRQQNSRGLGIWGKMSRVWVCSGQQSAGNIAMAKQVLQILGFFSPTLLLLYQKAIKIEHCVMGNAVSAHTHLQPVSRCYYLFSFAWCLSQAVKTCSYTHVTDQKFQLIEDTRSSFNQWLAEVCVNSLIASLLSWDNIEACHLLAIYIHKGNWLNKAPVTGSLLFCLTHLHPTTDAPVSPPQMNHSHEDPGLRCAPGGTIGYNTTDHLTNCWAEHY